MTTWIILRAAGIGSYVMLFLSVAFGLVATSRPFGNRFAKASTTSLHQFTSTVGLLLLAVHIGGLLLDRYIAFAPTQILIPGTSTYRPIPVGLGVVAMYAMVLVLVSSWFRRRYPTAIWRAIHSLSVPAFALSMVHGVAAGADATRPWMFLTYVATGIVVVFLLVLRGLTVGMAPQRRAQSSPRSTPASPSSKELGDGGVGERRSSAVTPGERVVADGPASVGAPSDGAVT